MLDVLTHTDGGQTAEAVGERPGKGAYIVTRDGDEAVEQRLDVRLLR